MPARPEAPETRPKTGPPHDPKKKKATDREAKKSATFLVREKKEKEVIGLFCGSAGGVLGAKIRTGSNQAKKKEQP